LKSTLGLALKNFFSPVLKTPTQVQLLSSPTKRMMNSIFFLLQGLLLFLSSPSPNKVFNLADQSSSFKGSHMRTTLVMSNRTSPYWGNLFLPR